MELSRRRIINYIPHKKTPYIRYTRERVETERINIPKEVYDDRKERFRTRIEAMIEYASTDMCRSQLLLRYFGETIDHDCGQCDVCLSRRK
jgi:ATP-dependent DNA helicase RecQ